MPRSFPRRFRYEHRPPWAKPESFGDIRPRGPLLPGRTLNPRLQKELRRANNLLAIGEHLTAGRNFIDLAERAYDRGIIYPAPMLYMQAAHAFLLGEDYAGSRAQARKGLELLAAQERGEVLRAESARYLAELGAQDRAGAAELRAWLDGLEAPVDASAAATDACPYCGAVGSLQPLAARGGTAAECRYCASIVLAG